MNRQHFAYVAHKLCRHFGLDFLRVDTLQRLLASERYADRSRILEDLARVLDRDGLYFFASRLAESHSQILQDLFVLFELQEKRNGFFVEFGATNGLDLSNTYLLEKDYGWTGILAEPARFWHEALHKNRTAIIDHRCVWRRSGERIEFKESWTPELSGIERCNRFDYRSRQRDLGGHYPVETVSLNDLLREHDAPACIDYLSVDTEGSELEILSAFDYSRYQVKVLTVEHNQTQQREKLFELLSSKGYVRKLETCSHFDDWYVKHRQD